VIAPFVVAPGNCNEAPLLREALPEVMRIVQQVGEQHLSVRWSADHGNRWTSRFRFPLAVEGEGSGSGKSRGAVAV